MDEPLTYEETPVIQPAAEPEPIPPFPAIQSQPQVQPEPEPQAPVQPPLPMPQKPHASWGNRIGYLILFILLFALGMWLSTIVRQYMPGSGPGTTLPVPTPPARQVIPTDPYAGWITYQIISGITRQPVANISFKLPPEVLSPICDGTGCPSQGTYLPGGTRFTVAARGVGQTLRDYRGAVVTDVLGQPFVTKDATTAGKMGVTFTGSFTGATATGYAFSRMRGAMIPVSDTLSIELNHFTPSGITADFESDDLLFEKILKSINLTTPAATSSGY